MDTGFFSDPQEAEIVQEIKLWSSQILEKPSSYFNDLPPCPYARKAWVDDKVAIVFKRHDSYQPLYSCISQFDETFDLVIVVDLANKKDPEEFHAYFDSLNDALAYSMIFVQRLSKLQEAADKLDKKGYYDSYVGEYNACEIFEKRDNLHRRLKNGYEAS